MSVITLNEYYSIIDELTDKGNLDQALNHCFYLIRQFPKCIKVYEKCGRIFIENNNYSGAIDVYTRLCAADPTNYLYHFYLAHVFSQCGQKEQARYHYDTMTCLKTGSDTENQQLLSMLHLDQVEESLFTNRDSFSSGVSAFFEGENIRAIRTFSASGFGKNSFLAEVFLSQALLQAGQVKEGVSRMEKILREFPRTLPILQMLCAYYQDVNMLRFKALLSALIDLDPFYSHWEIENNLIIPTEYPINVSYFDWTGVPNARVRVGWQQTTDHFLSADTAFLPQWLELLPNRSFVTIGIAKSNSNQPDIIPAGENSYQQSLFTLMSSEKGKISDETETAVPDITEIPVIEDLMIFPENEQPDIVQENQESTENTPEPVEIQENENILTENECPDSSENKISPEEEISMLRNAWKCFSMGNQAEGVELYKELLERNIQPERVQADLKKLLLLFPDNEDLQSIIQSK